MKKHILTFITFFLVVGYVNGQNTLTVNNNNGFVGNGTTTFTDLQQAVDAASAGDIIYIAGSITTYGTVNINKQIHIIGSGCRQDIANGIEQETFIATVILKTGASGTSIQGAYITNGLAGKEDVNTQINDITICNNRINNLTIKTYNNAVVPQNWIIKNNVINNVIGTSTGGGNYYMGRIQIVNNIIVLVFQKMNSSDLIVSHNLFLNPLTTNKFSHLFNVTFSSNIFYGYNFNGASGCSFYNNLIYDPYNNSQLTFDYGDNITDDTNIENVDPGFTSIVSNNFHWDNDYHLLPTSAALTAGPEDTEIGIYSELGSPFPEILIPNQPLIRELKIENRMIESGQQIQIRIKAEN